MIEHETEIGEAKLQPRLVQIGGLLPVGVGILIVEFPPEALIDPRRASIGARTRSAAGLSQPGRVQRPTAPDVI